MRRKLNFSLVLALIVIAWFIEPELYSQRPIDYNTPAKVSDEESLFRHLANQSDFVGIVKLIRSDAIVDPDIWKEEIRAAVTTSTLARTDRAVKGYVYEVQIVTPILTKQAFRNRKTLKVYSVGDPYTLHTRLVRFLPSREYLLFATKANYTEVRSDLETLDRQNPLVTKKLDAEKFVIVTGGQSGSRLLEKDDQIVRKVKKLLKNS